MPKITRTGGPSHFDADREAEAQAGRPAVVAEVVSSPLTDGPTETVELPDELADLPALTEPEAEGGNADEAPSEPEPAKPRARKRAGSTAPVEGT